VIFKGEAADFRESAILRPFPRRRPVGTLIGAGRKRDVDGGRKQRRGAIEVGGTGWVKDSRNAR